LRGKRKAVSAWTEDKKNEAPDQEGKKTASGYSPKNEGVILA